MITALALAAALSAASSSSEGGEAKALAKLAPAFKGTIVSVYPDGRKGHLLLSPNKTYRYTGRTGTKSSGAWRFEDGYAKVCLKQSKPVGIPLSYCTPIPSGKTWTAKAQTGEDLKVHVEPGR